MGGGIRRPKGRAIERLRDERLRDREMVWRSLGETDRLKGGARDRLRGGAVMALEIKCPAAWC